MWQAKILQSTLIDDEGGLELVFDLLRDGKTVLSSKSLRTNTETYTEDLIAYAKKLREVRVKATAIQAGTLVDLN